MNAPERSSSFLLDEDNGETKVVYTTDTKVKIRRPDVNVVVVVAAAAVAAVGGGGDGDGASSNRVPHLCYSSLVHPYYSRSQMRVHFDSTRRIIQLATFFGCNS